MIQKDQLTTVLASVGVVVLCLLIAAVITYYLYKKSIMERKRRHSLFVTESESGIISALLKYDDIAVSFLFKFLMQFINYFSYLEQ